MRRPAIDTTIGGTATGAGNVISGNGVDGITTRSFNLVTARPTSGTTIKNNLIGTDVAGVSAIANSGNGITIQGAQNLTIGGPSGSDRNVISGNAANGIAFLELPSSAPITGGLVQGNRIGTDITGTGALSNGVAGVLFGTTANPLNITMNTIGGTASGEGNTIWSNGSDGIAVLGGVRNRFLGNSIYEQLRRELGSDFEVVYPKL